MGAGREFQLSTVQQRKLFTYHKSFQYELHFLALVLLIPVNIQFFKIIRIACRISLSILF